MKIFVSVDMEGISAITDPEDVLPAGPITSGAGCS
jgi:D-aminopeptidase